MTAAPPERPSPQERLELWTSRLGQAAGIVTGRPDWDQHSSYNGGILYTSLLAEGRADRLAWLYRDDDARYHVAVSRDTWGAMWALSHGRGLDRAQERAAMEALFEAQLRLQPRYPDVDRDTSPSGADLVVSEGVIGLVVRERTDGFLDELGVTEEVPGIHSRFDGQYGPTPPRRDPHYAAAMDVLLDDIQRRSGDSPQRGIEPYGRHPLTFPRQPLDRNEVLDDMLRADPRDSVRALAAQVVDKVLVGQHHPESGWLVDGVLEPDDENGRRAATERLAVALEADLAPLAGATGSQQELTELGLGAGAAAAESLKQELAAIQGEQGRPSPDDFLRQVFAEQGQAAADVTWAHGSSFNGQTIQASAGEPSTALWDGSQTYDLQSVLLPMRRLAHNEGRPQSVEALTEQKLAIQLMFEQNIKMTHGPGRSFADSAYIYGGRDEAGVEHEPDLASASLSMGIAGEVANDPKALNDYIDKLGLEEYAPGLKDITLPPQNSPEILAAHEFSHHLAEVLGKGRTGGDVAMQLSTVDPARQWGTAARELMARHGLEDMITDPSDRMAAQNEIATAMKDRYAGVAQLHGADAEGQAIGCAAIGKLAAMEGNGAALRIAQRFSDPELAQVQAQALSGTLDPQQVPAQAGSAAKTDGARETGAHRAPENTKGTDGRSN